jgi:biotin operon repressor
METSTIRAITANTPLITEAANVPEELRAIAQFIAEPSHKRRLLAIASLLEREIPDNLFRPHYSRALQVYKALSAKGYADEELAQKMGCGLSTAKGTIQGLRQGGVDFMETAVTRKIVSPQGGRPPKKRRYQK